MDKDKIKLIIAATALGIALILIGWNLAGSRPAKIGTEDAKIFDALIEQVRGDERFVNVDLETVGDGSTVRVQGGVDTQQAYDDLNELVREVAGEKVDWLVQLPPNL